VVTSRRQRDTEAVEVLVARLRSLGYRMTVSRRAVLSALVSGTHRTAEELVAQVQKQAPDVHISTVYRNLEELERIGLVVHSHLGHGPATFQLTTEAHGHLVCERCGGSYHADSRMFAGLAREAKSRYGFEIRPFHFSVLGLCEGCRGE
jgi:Fur family ferric uptake transcriptional regulator